MLEIIKQWYDFTLLLEYRKHMDDETLKDLLDSLIKLNDAFEKDVRIVFDNITGRQLMVLAGISNMQLPATLGEVAAECGGSYQSMKHVIVRLNELGHISLSRDKEDKRKYLIDLTEKGAILGDRVCQQIDNSADQIAPHVGAEEVAALKKIVAVQEKYGGWLTGFKL